MQFPIASQIVTVFWIVMYPVLIVLYKRTLFDPNEYVKESVIRGTLNALQIHRKQVRKEFIQRELSQLARGEACQVLDVRQLDPKLSGRHLYFPATRAIYMDPSIRECHLRIQIHSEEQPGDRAKTFTATVGRDTISYLKIISGDGYLSLLSKYFDRLVLVIDRVESDMQGGDISIPMLSLLFDSKSFWQLYQHRSLDIIQLRRLGDMHFEEGKEIVPHRMIELPKPRGAK